MAWKYERSGPEYHWMLDLYRRMGLPVLDGVHKIVRSFNEHAQKKQEYNKKGSTIRKAQKALRKAQGHAEIIHMYYRNCLCTYVN